MPKESASYLSAKPGNKDEEINEILSVLGRDDLKFLRDLKKKKRNFGILITLLGFAIFFGTTYYYFIAGTSEQAFMWIFFGWIIAMSISREGIAMVTDAGKTEATGGGRYLVEERIQCVSCGYFETRPYTPGDYVGKEVDKVCPECGGKMKIVMIYGRPEKEIKTVGMPILPGLGGTSGSMSIRDKITLLFFRLVSPLGLVYRLYQRTEENREKPK